MYSTPGICMFIQLCIKKTKGATKPVDPKRIAHIAHLPLLFNELHHLYTNISPSQVYILSLFHEQNITQLCFLNIYGIMHSKKNFVIVYSKFVSTVFNADFVLIFNTRICVEYGM